MSDLIERLRSVDISWSETGEWCAEAAEALAAKDADIARMQARVDHLEMRLGQMVLYGQEEGCVGDAARKLARQALGASHDA